MTAAPDLLPDLPPGSGSYALYFHLEEPAALPIPRLRNPVLDPGIYVYAGSAFGPGGIRARVGRHLRTDKKPHWHIDHLSSRATCIDVKTYPVGRECDLVRALLADGATVPVVGFGSSDCRDCAAHLVRLAAGFQNGNIATQGNARGNARGITGQFKG